MVDAIKPVHASGFIFPNTIGGALDLDNLADRVIRPTLKPHNLANQLGFATVNLGKLHEGSALVHARGRTWGQLIFQDLFKKQQ